MAKPPLAESRGNQMDGWPAPTVQTVTSCMSLPLLMHPWETFIFLTSGGFEAHTTLCNGRRRHRHCQCVCDLVPWHTQGSRPLLGVCELLAYGHFPTPIPLMTPFADQGMVCCSTRRVFACLLPCATSLPCPPGCVSSPVLFALNQVFDLFSHTSYLSHPGGCE